MTDKPKIYRYKSLRNVVTRLRDDLRQKDNGGVDYVLLYAYNGTGKTRLSMEFKEVGKKKSESKRDTLYFNAFTEDLFTWDNDLEGNTERVLEINSDSKFFEGFKDLALEERIFEYLQSYTTFNFKIDYDNWKVVFSKEVNNPAYRPGNGQPEKIIQDNVEVKNPAYKPDNGKPQKIIEDKIKVSRGEENIFIWCVYLAICELVLDRQEKYNWVEYFYIDDPISSLDDNNAIVIATDLAKLVRKCKDKIKVVLSSHHGLFFNVMCNELKASSHKTYFIHKDNTNDSFILSATTDTPFFHHVASLSEIKKASDSGNLYTYHFNALRSILEKTAAFLGQDDFSYCLDNSDEALHARALNLLSHGNGYSLYQPVQMLDDNKKLFQDILTKFLQRFEFALPI